MTTEKRGLFLVVLGVFLLLTILFSGQAVSGCYLYPQGSSDLYCVSGVQDSAARADCNDHSDCNFDQYFVPGSDCSSYDECREVTCTADCQVQALGKCQQKNGQPVPDDEYNYWCSLGCCKIAPNFCSFGLNRFACNLKAEQLGVTNPNNVIFQNSLGMNLDQCNQLYCQVAITTGSIAGTVKDSQNNPLSGARIVLEGLNQETVSDSNGYYIFSSLNPSTYIIRVSASGHASASATISLAPGAHLTQDFTLAIAGAVGELKGKIKSTGGTSLESVTLFWNGPVSGQTMTDASGNYQAGGLPIGSYTITVSKAQYRSQETTIVMAEGTTVKDFLLQPAELQALQGTTSIDSDGVQQRTYGVRIYIDGVFRGYSQYPDGHYSIDVPEGDHKVSASYQDYTFGPDDVSVTSGVTNLNIILTKYIGECTSPNPPKNIEEFVATPIPGKKQVRLQWQKPCPEVLGYQISKNGDPFQTISPVQNSFIDEQAEWTQTYTYSIVAYYTEAPSPQAAQASITLGDQACEDRYHDDTGWETFCLIGDSTTRKTVYTCTIQNELIPSLNCAERDGEGEDFYCARISARDAECKDAGVCSLQGNPFGLYYTRNACYGSNNPEENTQNYCYYDFTDSIVNQCQSCVQVQNCFDYRSEEACRVDSCLGKSCQWVSGAANNNPFIDYGQINLPQLVTPETGQGYCVENDYNHDDKCSLCSSESTLFENFYCTAEVCSNLGRCFSDPELSECQSCGETPTRDANCYTYNTETECTGGRGVSKSPFSEFTLSQDQCDWGRCLWLSDPDSFSPGACVKDGDGNEQDDCAEFSAGEHRSCEVDDSPPRTKIIPPGVRIISSAYPTLTFEGDDNFHSQPSQRNKLGVLGFCLTSTDPNAQQVCEDFTEVPYLGKLTDETVTANILNSSYLQRQVKGESYRLKYYSTDKYHNQENLQEAFVFVDNVPPQFEINEEINTIGDTTNLFVFLEGINEPLRCSFELNPILPRDSKKTFFSNSEEQNKEVTFENLKGIIYNLTVSCEDDHGNKNQKSKSYVFDLEERIEIVYPALQQAVSSNSIAFKVNTVAGAQCALYNTFTQEKIADLVSDEEGKSHQTSSIPGFVEREYAGEQKVICQELFGPDYYEDYFHFIVDFTPPTTQIVLRENDRVSRPLGSDWEEFFVQKALVDFECDGQGFSCDKTYYCLGNNCNYITSPDFKHYKSTITIANSTPICYYSTDQANNPVFAPQCGTITIEGYEITLEKPSLHYYNNDQWGVSNNASFTWQFFTKVPTSECRFDFVPGFNYATVPGFKVLVPDNQGKYIVPNFPSNAGTSSYPAQGGVKSLYVKCTNSQNELSLEQKINLEYDPTAPNIKEAHADPNPLIEGNTIRLTVKTDDKTLCKYNDAGHTDYQSMNFAFPGAEADLSSSNGKPKKILQQNHYDDFAVNTFTGLTKDFILTTMCRNGAGDYSELKTIQFTADYTQLGGIIALWPNGDYLTTDSLTMSVETSKNALCQYKVNSTYTEMDGNGGRFHTALLQNLQEKQYSFPIKCLLGDHVVENQVHFIIDRTPPIISEVNDGNYTCGGPINVMVYTNENNISAYYYEVYSAGFSSGNISSVSFTSFGNPSSNSRTLVYNNTVDPSLPIEIPAQALIDNIKYVVKVQAIDGAEHWSQPKESNGIIKTSANFSICQQDKEGPDVIILANSSSCTSVAVELRCEDALGCRSFKFGKGASSCQADQTYLGQKISFNQEGVICYYAEDSMKHNRSGNKAISFLDEDGDMVSDSCDQCPDTRAGKVVDEKGCAEGELSGEEKKTDTDGDGLPDSWEKIYDTESCDLNYISVDSNNNGIKDTDEDYDDDKYTNLEEYRLSYNPCVADAMKKEGFTPATSTIPTVSSGGTDVVAWGLFIVGIVMMLSGAGYLIYYYKFSTAKSSFKPSPVQRSQPSEPFGESSASAPALTPWQEKLLQNRKSHQERRKRQERSDIFGRFAGKK